MSLTESRIALPHDIAKSVLKMSNDYFDSFVGGFKEKYGEDDDDVVKIIDKASKKWHNASNQSSLEETILYDKNLVKSIKKSTKSKNVDKLKDVNKPKQASSAYIFWSKEHRDIVKKQLQTKSGDDKISTVEVMKETGRQWNLIKDDKKAAKYHEMAQNDKLRYIEEMKHYTAPSQTELIERKEDEDSKKKEDRALKRAEAKKLKNLKRDSESDSKHDEPVPKKKVDNLKQSTIVLKKKPIDIKKIEKKMIIVTNDTGGAEETKDFSDHEEKSEEEELEEEMDIDEDDD